MKPSAIWLALFLNMPAAYHYQFPADHFDHPEFQTEWWYYTGNVHDASGHRYGFELTFFRQAQPLSNAVPNSVWRLDQIYLSHLALTDIDANTFYHTERLNRAGPGVAGANAASQKVWNGNWQVYWKNLNTAEQQLQAICDRFTLTLDLTPLKPVVINGKNGLSQKGSAQGEASRYLSFTRLKAQGALNGAAVSGQAWMDHEFFTQPADPTLTGWDWFAIQLNNNEELMLYHLRNRDNTVSSYSSGTFVDSKGNGHHLSADQIMFTPGRLWHKYPVEWRIAIPSLGLHLSEQTPVDDQELRSAPGSPSPTYWEGAVTYSGAIHDAQTQGAGYLEMSGYAEPFRIGH